MKRVFTLLTVLVMCLSLVACGNKKAIPEETATSPVTTVAPTAVPTVATTEATVIPTAITEATAIPTVITEPTTAATSESTITLTETPTEAPAITPTQMPTEVPTTKPTEKPTEAPAIKPTEKPATVSTVKPTAKPATTPTIAPSVVKPIACSHNWQNANCIVPKLCTVCGLTEGTTTGHNWRAATCIEPKLCIVCGLTEGTTTGHNWTAATCSNPKTCTVCSLTEGTATGHNWQNATCTTPKTCRTCGLTEGWITDHNWKGATCTERKTCITCGITAGAPLQHSWKDATCYSPLTCSLCGLTVGSVQDHNWKEATCLTPMTCADCGITEGTISDHTWKYATCISPDKCVVCGITQGNVLDHYWKKQVTKAPTQTNEGLLTYTCTTCNKSYTETIAKFTFDPEAYGDPYHIRTSNNPDNYIDLEINGSTLHISGKIMQTGLRSAMIECGTSRTTIAVAEGVAFSTELVLNFTEKSYITVYTQRNGDARYWSYLYDTISIIPTDGGYRFDSSLVLQHNIDAMKEWIDPRDCLSDSVSSELKNLAKTIVGSETDAYKKMYLLNKWVAENIYYDYDFFEGKSNQLYYAADEVYQVKRTVCEGYANLLKALLQAEGIPCIKVITYSTGVGTSGSFDESNYQITASNHAHIEAYLESEERWVTMDPTWDSGNTYQNGEFHKGNYRAQYFDISLDLFSYTHKILRRQA